MEFGRIVWIGNAAHAMTPNWGHGGGQAVEDSVILAGLLKRHSLADALEIYEKARIARTRKIAGISNRIERVARQLSKATKYCML